MSPWIKAGLIGGVILIVVDLLGLIPCVGCFAWIIALLAYVGIGALAAYWIPPLREAGAAAGQGALAATLAALVGGIINTIIFTIQTASANTAEVLSQVPAESLQQLEEMGWDPAMFAGPTAGAVFGSVCCVFFLLFAAILGAIGGAIFAAIKSD